MYFNYWKRNFRYRVARWGYSTAILAWERWNEHGGLSPGSAPYEFYQNYSQYQSQTDPYHHLRTTSQGSQTFSPALWGSSAFDIANFHDYMMVRRFNANFAQDEALFVYTYAQCLRTSSASGGANCPGIGADGQTWQGNKPIIWGELDTGTSVWGESNPQRIADHNVIWAGLFSPIGMAPIDWYFYAKSYLPEKYDWDKIAADFFNGVDYSGQNFTYLSTSDVVVTSQVISATPAKLRVLAMRSSDNSKAFAWAQNKDHNWGNGTTPPAISGSFQILGLSGSYRITYVDTYSGATTDGGIVTASGGNVTIPVSNLSTSVAVKIISTTAPPATPTPTSSACLAGDANNDKTVNLSDFTYLLTRFRQSPPQVCADQNQDGLVNVLDFGRVLLNLI